ncbi:hypothetical protein SZ64_01100 [Erythrobacter sp. SG61-1L]|nr:hypothetical protein SZ64_01100 [Erythrobacter sp. SG61-1L]
MAIRTASRAEAPIVQLMLEELAASIGKPGGIKGSVANIERFGFGPSRLFEALIASQSGVDVGLLLFFPEYSSWRGRPGIYVQDLYVIESARGAGVARALLSEVAQRCEEMEGTYLRLSASADNIAAQHFYLKAGFAPSDEERLFVLEGKDFAAFIRE